MSVGLLPLVIYRHESANRPHMKLRPHGVINMHLLLLLLSAQDSSLSQLNISCLVCFKISSKSGAQFNTD